ncbi:MAG: glycosyltransferase family 4 protein [Flavobacteriaceae bacterium]|nr:glycosyltransferase family 4 protein [Flavobacteriaceae bacterium]
MRRILIIGPFPKPITGMSLANLVVKKILDETPNYLVDTINTSYSKFDEKLGKFSLKKFLFYIKFNIQLYKIFQNKIIYITPGQTFFGITKYSLFILLSSLLKKEIVIHIHGNHLQNEYKNLTGIKKKTVYFLLSKTTKGIVLSKSLKNNMSSFIKEEYIYTLNNFAENYLVPKNKEIKTDKLRIVFLSNLMLEKGILELLQALKILEEQNIEYEAKIAGNIDEFYRDKVLNYFNKLKNTEYLGVVEGKQKKNLFKWSNIFVLPTYYKMEGQPISIIEAMATHHVIITTNHAGIIDMIKEGENGYFVEKKSIKSIVNTFKFLNKNKHKIERISKNNKLVFDKKFTMNHFKENLIKILNS